MKIPPTLQIALLTVALTAFYTMVGQSVPQKEVHPPEVIEIPEDLSTQELVDIGKEIFEGKGICHTCHTIGKSGALRFPDLQGIAARAATRKPDMTALQYLAESLFEPDIYVVEGFAPGMPAVDQAPIGLTDGEIRAVLAYLQTLGGQATITMQTSLDYTRPMLEGTQTAEAAAGGGDSVGEDSVGEDTGDGATEEGTADEGSATEEAER